MREMSQVLDSDLENVSVITTDAVTLRAWTFIHTAATTMLLFFSMDSPTIASVGPLTRNSFSLTVSLC